MFAKLLTTRRGRALGLGLLAFLMLAGLSFLHLGQTVEYRGLDFCYRLRGVEPPPPELLIIGIDEPSFQELRRPWPWPRRFHAELIRRLKAAGARLIAFDVLFADPTQPEDDQLLAQAMAEAGNVILSQTLETALDRSFSRQILVRPLESLSRAARGLALTVLTPDPDGVVRHFRLKVSGLETLPAAVWRTLRPQEPLPPDLSGLIHFAGPPRSLDTVSYYQVLDPERPLPAARIRDRIVLIGSMMTASAAPQGQADAFYTPFFFATHQLMSGVEVQGQIIHTLWSGRWGREFHPALRLGLSLALLLLAAWMLARLRPLPGLAVLAGLILLLLGGAAYLFLTWNLWVPPILLSVSLTLIYSGNLLGQYLLEFREKRWLRQAFGRYVSPALVEVISAHPERLELGGEEVEATVLFSDLAGFTPLSEKMAPKDLIHLLNEYFTAMTQIILSQRGTLDKFIGDAIMAQWGAPIPLADHARRACEAALQMQAAMRGLQQQWLNQGLPLLQARIGIHSGPVVAGNVGSRERFNYTVMGDAVNLASRLEGVNKYYDTEILVSETTYHQVQDVFLVRELDQVQVKGRAQAVTIYELLDYLPAAGLPPWLESFAAGRAAYLERRWSQAESLFQETLQLKAEDGPARLYLQRCRNYRQEPPPPEWQGVHVLESK
jgi:adenylate cyclase